MSLSCKQERIVHIQVLWQTLARLLTMAWITIVLLSPRYIPLRKSVALCVIISSHISFLFFFSFFVLLSCLKVPDTTCVGVSVSYWVLTILSLRHQTGCQGCYCQTPVSRAWSKRVGWLSHWVALLYPMALAPWSHLGHAPLCNPPLNTVSRCVMMFQSRVSSKRKTYCLMIWGWIHFVHCSLQWLFPKRRNAALQVLVRENIFCIHSS